MPGIGSYPGNFMRFTLRFTTLAFLAGLILVPGMLLAASDYVGSESCKSCHAAEWSDWRQSHHYQAMLPATYDKFIVFSFVLNL